MNLREIIESQGVSVSSVELELSQTDNKKARQLDRYFTGVRSIGNMTLDLACRVSDIIKLDNPRVFIDSRAIYPAKLQDRHYEKSPIEEFCRENDINTATFSKLSGIDKAVISKLKNGKRKYANLRMKTVIKLCDTLGIDNPKQLLNFD